MPVGSHAPSKEEVAEPHDVDRAAPVLAHHEVEIDAPGSSFDWASYGFSVRSTIYDVDARAPVLWGGTAAGAVALGVAEAPVSSAQECLRPARR